MELITHHVIVMYLGQVVEMAPATTLSENACHPFRASCGPPAALGASLGSARRASPGSVSETTVPRPRNLAVDTVAVARAGCKRFDFCARGNRVASPRRVLRAEPWSAHGRSKPARAQDHLVIAAVLLACAVVLLAWGGENRQDGFPNGGRLVYGEYGRPATLDPITSNDMVLRVTELLFNGLVSFSPKNEVVADLADWEVSPDNRVYTFKLRRDILCPRGAFPTTQGRRVSLAQDLWETGWRTLLLTGSAMVLTLLFSSVTAISRQRNATPEAQRDSQLGAPVGGGGWSCYDLPMSPKAEKILEEALELPDSARADLAAALLESLDQDVDEDVEAAWSEEISRRIQEVESGAVKPIPWEEARKMIFESRDEAKRR